MPINSIKISNGSIKFKRSFASTDTTPIEEKLKKARSAKYAPERAMLLAQVASQSLELGLNKTEAIAIINEALAEARTIKHSGQKVTALAEIALAMQKIGMEAEAIIKVFNEALVIADLIDDLEDKSNGLWGIASDMAKAGLFTEALTVARSITDQMACLIKAEALSDIALEMAKAGKPTEEFSLIFKEALVFTKQTWNRDFTQQNIVGKMTKAKLSIEEIEALFKSLDLVRPKKQ